MRSVFRTVAAATAVLSVGCAPSLGPPSAPDSGWLEARSPHFVVRTELDPEAADATVIALERMFAAFEQVAYPHQPKPKFVTELVVFDGQRALDELGYAGRDGVMLSRSGPDLEERLTLITYGRLGGAGRDHVKRVFQHELAHRFTAFYFPAAPVWLSEGLSELFSTLAIEDERVVVGKYVAGAVFTNGPWAVTRGGGSWFVNVPLQAAPSVRELQSLSPARFYGDEASSDPKSDAALKERTKNYAAAWNLVHLLVLGDPGSRARFTRFLRAVARGEQSPSEAWSAELGELDEEIERGYRALLPQTTRTVAAVPFRSPPITKPFLEPLSPADVHLLRASIRSADDPSQLELAVADLDRAIALDSKHTEARFARAFKRLGRKDLAGAKGDLESARTVAPGDPRLFQLELMLAIEQDDARAAERSAFALSRRAKTAAQHALLASYYVTNGKPRTAIRFAKHGIATDSTCWRCFAALAEADASLGNPKAAVVALTTAINLLSEEDPRRRRARERLAELERLAVASR